MLKLRLKWTMAVLLSILPMTGCGGPFKPVYLEGLVTLDGEPLAGATVTFLPEDGDGHPASGFTDQEGVFKLTTFKKNDGALPGEYCIVVTKIQSIEAPPEANSGEADAVLKHYKSLKSQGRRTLLPPIYAQAATTPFHCAVPPPDKQVILALQGSAK